MGEGPDRSWDNRKIMLTQGPKAVSTNTHTSLFSHYKNSGDDLYQGQHHGTVLGEVRWESEMENQLQKDHIGG